MPALRPYQVDALTRVRAAWASGARRICLSSPTGSGKTVMATEGVIRPAIALGKRVLFLAHREELIVQCYEKLPPELTGIIKAGHYPRPEMPCQVASVQTLSRRVTPPADIVIIDECHRVMADSYKKILAAYPAALHLGMSATAYRGDGRGLSAMFDHLEVVATTTDLITDGFLVPSRTFAPPAPPLEGVRTTGGDYNAGDLAIAVDKPKLVGDVVETWRKHARGRKTIVFACSVQHSLHLVTAFEAAGIRAMHLDGETPADQRRGIIHALREGELEVVVNVGVLTEGTDIPPVSCIVLARPTKSRGLWKQMVGRGLRTHPGKVDCIILDHAGSYHRHGLVTDPETLTLAGVTRPPATTGQPIRQCLHCYAVVPAGLAACPECAVVFPKAAPRVVTAEAGELTEVTAGGRRVSRAFFPQREAERMNELVASAVHHARKPGWVGHMFKAEFRRWPCSMAQIEQLMAAHRCAGCALAAV